MAARMTYGLLVLFASVLAIYGYSTGAPEEVCEDMMPQHAEDPQIDNFPYIIKPSRSRMRPNEKVNVTISSNKGIKFKGFLVQARVGDIPYGTFDAQDGVKLLNCRDGKKNTATHTNSIEKDSITLTWTAPPKLEGNVKFTATVAKNGAVFWVKRKSSPVRVSK